MLGVLRLKRGNPSSEDTLKQQFENAVIWRPPLSDFNYLIFITISKYLLRDTLANTRRFMGLLDSL